MICYAKKTFSMNQDVSNVDFVLNLDQLLKNSQHSLKKIVIKC